MTLRGRWLEWNGRGRGWRRGLACFSLGGPFAGEGKEINS
jgi:hypothetical protein